MRLRSCAPPPASKGSGDLLSGPSPTVHLVLTGGFTGLTRSASMGIDELEPAEAARTASALRTLRAAGASDETGVASSQPRYELTIHDGADVHTIVLHQSQIPAELQPLLHALEQRM